MQGRRWIEVLCCTVFVGLSVAGTASANNAGVFLHSGKTPGTDCGDCHGGGSFGASIQIARADNTPLTPLSTHAFTVTVTGSGAVKAGFNLAQDLNAAVEGVLSSGDSGVAAPFQGELAQNSGRQFGGGTSVSWSFSWKLPSVPDTYTLFAAGAICNGTGDATGDQPVTTSPSFEVVMPPTATPSATATPTKSVTPTRTPTPTVTATPPPSGGACGDPDDSGTVTVSDGVQTLRAAADLSSLCTLVTCDVDGNGVVSVTDGVNVLRTAAGLSAPENCPAP